MSNGFALMWFWRLISCPKNSRVAAAFIAASTIGVSHGAAATTLIVDAIDSGWYHTETGTGSENYAVGDEFGGTFRNFFVFDLADVGGGPISAATFQVYTGGVIVSDVYTIYDVETDISLLRMDWTPSSVDSPEFTAIFEDLGSGTEYGRGIVPDLDNAIIDFTLNGSALADMNSANGLFAIGGTYPIPSDGLAFTGTDIPVVRRLAIEIVPEPSTAALVAAGLVMLAQRSRDSRR